MKNIYLPRYRYKTSENFTSAFGIKARRILWYALHPLLKIVNRKKINVIDYPKLKKGRPYIFASTHYYVDEVISALATIDRNAWLLMGTKDTIDHNPSTYIVYLNGLICLNKFETDSRKDCVNKMEKIINNGSSVFMFPEGVYNNSENLLVENLFKGVHELSQRTGCEVVPIANFTEIGVNELFIRFAKPINIGQMKQSDGLELLRDTMATMMWELVEEHSTMLTRKELSGKDIHYEHMKDRRAHYMEATWKTPIWEEELFKYTPKNVTPPQSVRASIDKVRIGRQNAYIMLPIIQRRAEDMRYDFKNFMQENWNKV